MELAPTSTPFDEGCTAPSSWWASAAIAAIVAAFALIALAGLAVRGTPGAGAMSVPAAIGVFVLVLWVHRAHRNCDDRDAYLALTREGMPPAQAELQMRQLQYARRAARHAAHH